MQTDEPNPIECLRDLTADWKGSLQNYCDAAGHLPGSSLNIVAARASESDRQALYSRLRNEINRLRAAYPGDPALSAAWELFQARSHFLLFAEAEVLTPHLEALISHFTAESQNQTHQTGAESADPSSEMRGSAKSDKGKARPGRHTDFRTIHENWVKHGWPRRLLRARSARGMTQKEAAHECGVLEETYERWERGQQPPAIRNIARLLAFIEAATEQEPPAS